MTNLVTLYLYDNQLRTLPPEIWNLTNLFNLRLHYNQLTTDFYCYILPMLIDNNPTAYIEYDPNPNPISNDCSTDMTDFSIFAANWQDINCEEINNWCDGADLNHINGVDIEDLAEFVSYWLQ